MAQQTFNSGDTAPAVRDKLNNNANDVTAHVANSANPHGSSLTQAYLAVTNSLALPNGTVVRSLSKFGESALTDAVTLSEGSGITLTQNGQDLAVSASAVGLVRVCQHPKIVIPDIYGDGYLSIPCTDHKTSENFQPETGAASFIMAAQVAETGSSYELENSDYELLDYAYSVGHGSEGEPYDSFPMVWYDAEAGPVYEDGVWRFIVQYRNIDRYLALWCRAERVG